MTTIPSADPAARIAGTDADQSRISPPSTVVALGTALDRIEEVLEAEDKALSQPGHVDLQDINRRKSHCLLELTRISRVLPREGVSPELLKRIGTMRDRLLLNQQTLQVHLAAAQEISRVLTEALGDAESDGTYSRLAGVQAPGGDS